MKTSPKKYAKALFEIVKDQSDEDAKETIRLFIQALVRSNNLSQIDKIIDFFDIIWDKENDILKAEIVSSHPLDKQNSKLLKEFLLKKTNKKIIESEELVDKNILGGIIMKYEDKILDGSLRKRLSGIKEEIIK